MSFARQSVVRNNRDAITRAEVPKPRRCYASPTCARSSATSPSSGTARSSSPSTGPWWRTTTSPTCSSTSPSCGPCASGSPWSTGPGSRSASSPPARASGCPTATAPASPTSTTLQLGVTAANRVTHQLLQGLADNDLRGATGNVIVAHPAGILGGVDHQWTGKVERVDTAMLRGLLDHEIIPVVPPLGFDGEGRTYRLNSDAVAVEVAKAVEAVKLIYLSAHKPPKLDGRTLRTLTTDEAADDPQEEPRRRSSRPRPCPSWTTPSRRPRRASRGSTSSTGRCPRACSPRSSPTRASAPWSTRTSTSRSARPRRSDLRAIHGLIQRGVEADELMRRTEADVERHDRRLLRVRGGQEPGRLRGPAPLPGPEEGGGGQHLRRPPAREPGDRRQAHQVRRGPGPGRSGSSSSTACPRRRSTSSSKRAGSSSARPTTCRRPGATCTTGAAGSRRSW